MPTRTQELWIFDKVTLEKQVFGEFENNFSASLVLDKTRDSAKVVVYNYNTNVVLPNTICYMPTLNLWWIVANDRATRHANGMYEHELQLLGAIEIFAHRDMINCGFNKDRYTLGTFLTRLASFIDFELPISFDYTYYNQDKRIEYIKTFENFTPLSAIKEMFDGINAIPKMTFTITANVLTGATIHIIPKTGIDNEPIDISDFDDEREVKTIDRNSYGSSVVSNARNCVCGQTIRYPLTGGVTYQCETSGKDEWENTVIKLPTKAEYVEELIIGANTLHFRCNDDGENHGYLDFYKDYINYDFLDESNYEIVYNEIFYNRGTAEQKAFFEQEHDEIISMLKRETTIVMKNGTDFEFANAWEHPLGDVYEHCYFDEELKKDLKDYADNCIYWKQGSNLIRNFKWLGKWTEKSNKIFWRSKGYLHDFLANNKMEYGDELIQGKLIYNKHNFYVFVGLSPGGGYFKNPPLFAVKYRPQVDTKIKIDNDITSKDTNIYNQNGKLVDSQALAKLLSSHANEIKSEEITRYKTYKSFDNVPSVGSVVDYDGTNYIINNLSLDFHELENDYYINAVITLTREVACKSTMVSGNKNIRDYDCPQNYNVDREQVYRDYYEFDYEYEQSSINPTYNLNNIDKTCRFVTKGHYLNDYMLLMHIDTGHAGKQYNDLYFKCETVRVNLCKSMVVIADFGDNNIIGYTKANTTTPVFDLVSLFYNDELYTYPISYVDSIGELKSIDISLVNQDQFLSLKENYFDSIGEDTDKIRYFNYQPMIPQEMWEECETGYNTYDLLVKEPNYKKDGLEKPKFEFITQFGNANGIVIGNDFLEEETCEDDEILLYYWKIQDKIINEDNVDFSDDYSTSGETTVNMYNACSIRPSVEFITLLQVVRTLQIDLYSLANYTISSGATNSTVNNIVDLKGKNVAFCMAKIDKYGVLVKQKMLFGINNIKVNATNQLKLYINSWKLK